MNTVPIQPPIQPPIPPQVTPPLNKKKAFFIILILFLTILIFSTYTVGLLVWTGLYTVSFDTFPKILNKKNLISEDELPIEGSLVKNPIIFEWFGSIEGKLIEKNTDSFTIENKGNRLTIGIHPKLTGFYSATDSSKITPDHIVYDKVLINSYLRGNIIIKPKTTTGLGGKHVVGNVFDIIQLPSK